jgi:hypothetical protein
MLHRGDHVPHFDVTDIGGRHVRYGTIWQERPLVLLCLPPERSAATDDNVDRMTARLADLADVVACVITRDPVPDVDAPAAIVADQWGEVAYVATAPGPERLPDPEELRDWIQFVRIRCPECEGEAR